MTKTFQYNVKICRRYITLVELMIVLAIIGSVAGIIGININKAMRQQRFQVEVCAIIKHLRLAQNLMVILNADAKVKFAKGPQGGTYSYGLELKCPLESAWEKELLRKSEPLKEIINISLMSESLSKNSSTSPLEIDFYSGGAFMTKGTLKLISRLGEERYIHLRGAPGPLKAISSRENILSYTKKNQNDHHDLAMQTKQDLNSRMPPKKNQLKQNPPPIDPLAIPPEILSR